MHDIQLNQLPTQKFRELIAPTEIFHFDWSGKTIIPNNEVNKFTVKCNASGSIHAFFMWWILKMDQEGEIRLSCAPHWAHEDFQRLKMEMPNTKPIQNVIPWRDHWMQAIYYNPKQLHVSQGDEIEIQCSRDEYSLWFEAKPKLNQLTDNEINTERPLCSCGFHLAYSRTRIGQMNDNLRTKKFMQILENEIDANSTVLFISDGSLIGLSIAAMNVKHIYLFDTNLYSRQVMQKYIIHNGFKNITLIAELNNENIPWTDINLVIGEPNFCSTIIPIDNFYFGDLVNQIRPNLNKNVKILPHKATIEAMPVECLDLQKIIAPFNICESFDLTIFDKIIEVS